MGLLRDNSLPELLIAVRISLLSCMSLTGKPVTPRRKEHQLPNCSGSRSRKHRIDSSAAYGPSLGHSYAFLFWFHLAQRTTMRMQGSYFIVWIDRHECHVSLRVKH